MSPTGEQQGDPGAATWPQGPVPLVVRSSRPAQASVLFVVVAQLPTWAVLGWFAVEDRRWVGLAVGAAIGLLLTWLFRSAVPRAFTTLTLTPAGIEERVPGHPPFLVTYDEVASIGYRQMRGARMAILHRDPTEPRTIELQLDRHGVYRPSATRWWPAVAAELLRQADARGVPVQPRTRRELERFARR